MDIIKENNQAHIIRLMPEDVESAIRQFICTCHPEYAKDWILNPKLPLGAIEFAGTKK